MDFYDGWDLTLEVNGTVPQCLENVTLSEVLELEPSQNDNDGWARVRPNNQGYEISFGGYDRGAFALLRGLKRALNQVTFTFKTDDNAIVETGSGFITEVFRTSDADNDDFYSAKLVGYGAIV